MVNIDLCFPEKTDAEKHQLLRDNFVASGIAFFEAGVTSFGFYPGVILDNNGYNIQVGIMNVEDFSGLDRYEGVPDLYTRELITIDNEKVYIYIPSKSLMQTCKVEILPNDPKKYTTISLP